MNNETTPSTTTTTTTTKRIARVEFERLLIAALLERKYAFLYAKRKSTSSLLQASTRHKSPIKTTTISNSVVFAYIIHKIEIYPRYNYPTVQNNNNIHNHNHNDAMDTTTQTTGMIVRPNDSYVVETESSSSSSSSPPPPYRTVSHYGFNYPLTYLPTISLYPPNLLAFADDITAVQLQRHLVIEFIKSTALSLKDVVAKDPCISVKEIHLASASSCHETTDETEEEQINYTTVKQLKLMRPAAGRRKHWQRTISSSSSTAHSISMTASTAPTTSTYPEHEEDDSLSTNFSHCSISSPPPPHSAPVAPPLPKISSTDSSANNYNIDNKNILRTYIFRKSQRDTRDDLGGGMAEVEYIQRNKPEAEQQENHANENTSNDEEININKRVSLKRRASSTSSVSTSPTVGACTQQLTDELNKEQQQQQKEQKPLVNENSDEEKCQRILKEATMAAALTAASVKAHINAEQQTLEIHISICTKHQHQNQLHDEYFKHLSNIIDAEMQLISQQLIMGEEQIENLHKITQNSTALYEDNKASLSSSIPIPPPPPPPMMSSVSSSPRSLLNAADTTSSTIRKSSNNVVSQTLNSLESELEKLLNGILRINNLTHNLRTACAAVKEN